MGSSNEVKKIENASREALKVYESLTDSPLNAESIMLKTKMNLPQVFSSLTELEILDLVKSLPGGKYKRIWGKLLVKIKVGTPKKVLFT